MCGTYSLFENDTTDVMTPCSQRHSFMAYAGALISDQMESLVMPECHGQPEQHCHAECIRQRRQTTGQEVA